MPESLYRVQNLVITQQEHILCLGNVMTSNKMSRKMLRQHSEIIVSKTDYMNRISIVVLV
jgi:hypothetical protein